MNGLVLGNDPAIHLQRANSFLQTGKIPLSDIAWYPPLYHILLATLIAFTGASSLSQMLFVMKSLTVVIDWLLVFSVYLIGAKFFGKKVGAIASVLMLLSFPLYEINFWGGYTGILSLAFMFLLFLYLPLATKGSGNVAVTFLAAFSLVLSHQLATFLAVIILPPFILVMLVRSKGRNFKVWLAAILGGGIAFLLYYFEPIITHLDVLVSHVFFQQKTMLFQIPATTLNAFMVNFGFIFFFAFAGIVFAFFKLRAKKNLGFYLLLSLSFFVPLFLSQSYVLGLYLPFQWFIYYLLPSMAVLAAVSFSFIVDKVSAFYRSNKKLWKRLRLKTATVSVILLVSLMLVFRFGTVYGKIMEGSVFYSTSDVKGYDAGLWLQENYPGPATVVVTQVPGSWFGLFSGKTVIAETDPIIDRNVVAESVLSLDYELEHPLTMVRAYESMGDISDENYVSIDNVWRRVSFSSENGDFLSYSENGVAHYSDLSNFTREIVFKDQSNPKKITIKYFNDEVALTETISVQNDSYPINVDWTLSPLKSDISDVTFYLSTFFDLYFSFEKAYIPGILNWENPWSHPSNVQGNEWAVTNFSRTTLTDNYIGLYDDKNAVAFALKFTELPDWGNIGALSNMQIDAVRFQYQLDKVTVNQPVTLAYQVLTFSESSYPDLQQPSEMKSLFDFKPASAFTVQSRDYHDYIKEFNIGFLVYDKNKFDTKLTNCKLLELIYSNDRYVICKVKSGS